MCSGMAGPPDWAELECGWAPAADTLEALSCRLNQHGIRSAVNAGILGREGYWREAALAHQLIGKNAAPRGSHLTVAGV
jgi:hypothetical protein